MVAAARIRNLPQTPRKKSTVIALFNGVIRETVSEETVTVQQQVSVHSTRMLVSTRMFRVPEYTVYQLCNVTDSPFPDMNKEEKIDKMGKKAEKILTMNHIPKVWRESSHSC